MTDDRTFDPRRLPTRSRATVKDLRDFALGALARATYQNETAGEVRR